MPSYKLSHYNHFLRAKDGRYLVYNAIGHGLARVDEDIYRLLLRGEKGIDELARLPDADTKIEFLKSGNIIVDSDLDELLLLRTRMNMNRFGNRTLALTIVPTLGCNLRCVYCYESERSSEVMSEDTCSAIVDFVEKQIDACGFNSVMVYWFGGEPLLCLGAIRTLSTGLMKMCKKKKATYNAMAVTNGTILNRKIARTLKSLNVRNLQITIDGLKETHDRRRPFQSGTKSSFDTIVRNIDRTLGMLPFQIRINVDRTNVTESMALIDVLREKGWFDKPEYGSFYLGFTRVWTATCSGIESTCLSIKEFSEAELDFHKDLMKRGFTLSNLYPNQFTYCSAASPRAFIIDPRGELYKCWADVGNKEAYFGNVGDEITFNSELLQWVSWDPLLTDKDCKACTYFPICGGGCPYVPLRNKSEMNNRCTTWKQLMKEKMELFLKQRERMMAERDRQEKEAKEQEAERKHVEAAVPAEEEVAAATR